LQNGIPTLFVVFELPDHSQLPERCSQSFGRGGNEIKTKQNSVMQGVFLKGVFALKKRSWIYQLVHTSRSINIATAKPSKAAAATASPMKKRAAAVCFHPTGEVRL
jgi:hypothetical protein